MIPDPESKSQAKRLSVQTKQDVIFRGQTFRNGLVVENLDSGGDSQTNKLINTYKKYQSKSRRTTLDYNDKVYIAKLRPDAIIPSKRDTDGCYDIYACFDDEYMSIQPHSVCLVPTGICSAFDSMYRIGVRERGSNTKSNLKVSAGQIDSSYRGEWFIALYNANQIPIEITKNIEMIEVTPDFIRVPYAKAIAQFAVEFVPQVEMCEVALSDVMAISSERGDGRLGSTGK